MYYRVKRKVDMRPQSAKAKGRRLQQNVCQDLLSIFPQLEPDDIRSTSMGCNGEDCQLSPAARKLIPCAIECKNVERLNIWSTVDQALANANGHHPMIVMKKNNTKPWAAVPWPFFLTLLRARVDALEFAEKLGNDVCYEQNVPKSCDDDEEMTEPSSKKIKEDEDDYDLDAKIKEHIDALAKLSSLKWG